MDRWSNRNRLNKRDVIELKREFADIKMMLDSIEKLILQKNMRTIKDAKKELVQGQMELQEGNKNLLNISEDIMERLLVVTQMCQNTNNKCDDVEKLMKMLLMDSLMEEVSV